MTVIKSFIKSSDDRARFSTPTSNFSIKIPSKRSMILLWYSKTIFPLKKILKDYLPVKTGYLFLYIIYICIYILF